VEKEYKDLRTVMQEWHATPRALGTTQASMNDLLDLFHANDHIFAKGQLKNLWKTGKGMAQIPVRFYNDIRFRNLLDYRTETDDFISVAAPINKKDKKKRAVIIPDDECDDSIENCAFQPEFGWNDIIEDPSDVESSIGDSEASSDDSGDDADDDSDYNGDGGQIRVCDIDIHGVEQQLKDDAANNRPIQEMAYFGIEKVLIGENPGIFDYGGYTNALRTIALLDDSAFSDRIVGDLFKSLPIAAVSFHICIILARIARQFASLKLIILLLIFQPPMGNRKSEPLFVIDLFIDGVAIFNNSMLASCMPILGKLQFFGICLYSIPDNMLHFLSNYFS
jgi:hypothetical protein